MADGSRARAISIDVAFRLGEARGEGARTRAREPRVLRCAGRNDGGKAAGGAAVEAAAAAVAAAAAAVAAAAAAAASAAAAGGFSVLAARGSLGARGQVRACVRSARVCLIGGHGTTRGVEAAISLLSPAEPETLNFTL
jgi:hypothetical protein